MEMRYNRIANEEALANLGEKVDAFVAEEMAKYTGFCLPLLHGITDLSNLVLQFIGLPIANPIANPREAWIYSHEAIGWDIDEQQGDAYMAVNSGRFYNALKHHWPERLLRQPEYTLYMIDSETAYGRAFQSAVVLDKYEPFESDCRWIRCEEVPYTRRQLNRALGLDSDSDIFGPEKRVNDILFGANTRLTNDAYHRPHYKIGGYFPTNADGEVQHFKSDTSSCEECVKSNTKGQKFTLCLKRTRVYHAIEWCAEHPHAACTFVPIHSYW